MDIIDKYKSVSQKELEIAQDKIKDIPIVTDPENPETLPVTEPIQEPILEEIIISDDTKAIVDALVYLSQAIDRLRLSK